jgi:hypothetical protein
MVGPAERQLRRFNFQRRAQFELSLDALPVSGSGKSFFPLAKSVAGISCPGHVFL